MRRQRAETQDEVNAVGIPKVQVYQYRGIATGARALDGVIERMCEINSKAGGAHPHSDDFCYGQIVIAEQQTPRRCLYVDVNFSTGTSLPDRKFDIESCPATWSVLEADLSAKPLNDLLDDTQSESCSTLPS